MAKDYIEKKILLHSTLDRVWRAITESAEFGSWFGMKFDGPFSPGATMKAEIVPTTVDPEVAKSQEPYAGTKFEIMIERIEPQRLFSYRWHPGSVDADVDYNVEPTTLVTFQLEEQPDGVLLTLTETGFDKVPLPRRAKALELNDGGWAAQMTMIQKYLAREDTA